MLHRTPATSSGGSLYRTPEDERTFSKSQGIAGLANTAMLLGLLAVTARMNRTLLHLRYPRTWSLHSAAVRQSESPRTGRHLHLLGRPNSNRPWIPWKSARDNGMQRDELSRWNTLPLTARTREARQALFLLNRPTSQLPEPAERERGPRPKAPWRLCLPHNDQWCHAKRLARKRCRLRRALARAEPPQTRRHSLPSPRLADPSLVEHLPPGATRTASRLLLRLLLRLHKVISPGQSLDLDISSLGLCHRLRDQRKPRLVASMVASRACHSHRCNPLSQCHSRTSAATSAAPPWEASQTGCLGAATHADNLSRHRKVAHPWRSETVGTRPSA